MIICHANYPHVSNYVQAWKLAIRLAQEGYSGQVLMDRDASPITAHQARQEFLAALNARINSRGGVVLAGKKDCRNYRGSMTRDMHRVRDKVNQRVRVYQFETSEVRRRFSRLLDDPHEI